MKSVHMISLGCPKNLVDSENMLGLLKNSGIEHSANAPGADAVIINTCGFLQSSVKESLDTILEMVDLKQQGKIKRVVVTGCLTQRYGGDLQKELPEVDLFLGTGNFHRIATYLEELEGTDGNSHRPGTISVIPDPDYLYDHNTPRLQATLPHTAYMKVSEGCSRTCTFCIIPKLRGDLRSRSIDSLVQEATQLAAAGVVEINLIAQDLTAYGKELKPRQELAELLRRLCRIEGLRWIRLHYAYPHGFNDELIAVLRDEEKICPYIDMPLQHIDEALLKSMRRQTSETAIRELLAKLRAGIPNLTVRTTMIVGFPGESEAAFEKLYEFIREQRFERLGVFTYSREPGTPAAEMPGQIAEKVKTARRDKIMKLQQSLSLENNARLVGKRFPALIERRLPVDAEGKQVYYARLQSQAPDVDGKTVIHSVADLKVGAILPVKVEGASAYDLFALPV